ncbi:MAG: 4Fe-4S binding protein [Lamprocystis purpurea]|nr:4Fe-4S binding protein [Lamprocystis purpurea]
MWITSKIKQILMVMKPGIVTLDYPRQPAPAPTTFRGQPVWDHHKCLGCGGCANHCPALHLLRPLRGRLSGRRDHDEQQLPDRVR